MLSAIAQRRYLIPFRATLLPQIFTDVLVIGAGVAGLRAALEASTGTDVIVIGKGTLEQSNTFWAQGGVAAVVDPEDSFASHVQDTLTAGAGLCDQPIVEEVVQAGPQHIRELIEWGMRFDRVSGGDGDDQDPATMALGREGGHGHCRILHTDGDATGKALALCLYQQVQARQNIRFFDQCFVLDLITSDTTPARCLGVIAHHPQYGLQVIWAGATILATGGCGQAYRESTNPSVATGDGLAMAYRAGADLMDMAFMQFHPTTLYVAGASRSLITEAVRGEGAHLVDRQGYRFMPDYDERAELAPRDVVSRSIIRQMTKTGSSHVFLDISPIGAEAFSQRFPGINALLRQFEIDPATMPIPVHPSAHYMIGGVWTDDQGRTRLPGLFACGEVACTGLNGANRLASNSLLEGLVFGARAGRAAQAEAAGSIARPVRVISDIPLSDRSELDVADVRSSLRSVMWRHVGIERSGARLAEVLDMIGFWARYTMDKIFDDRAGWEIQNLLTVGALMTQAAHWREESRGTHHRLDHQSPVPAFAVHDRISILQSDIEQVPVAGALR